MGTTTASSGRCGKFWPLETPWRYVAETLHRTLRHTALAPAPGPLAGTKRDAMGTEKQRWANRLDRNVIAAQIAHGCKCGCVDTHATAGDIIAARTLQKDKSGEERRQFLRGLLPGLLNPDTLLGVSLNWGDTNTPACVKGFSLRHGFSESWTYDIVRAYVKVMWLFGESAARAW